MVITHEWIHICPGEPSTTSLKSYSYAGEVCPECNTWFPKDAHHVCPTDPQTALLKEIVELLSRIAEKISA
jgi:hypothetical protein